MTSFRSLKSYFASTRRLVKQNDVIALTLTSAPPDTLQDEIGDEDLGLEL